MRELILKPEICSFDTFDQFVAEFSVEVLFRGTNQVTFNLSNT